MQIGVGGWKTQVGLPMSKKKKGKENDKLSMDFIKAFGSQGEF